MFDLLQSFALLLPPSNLNFPASSFEDTHKFLLNRVLLDSHLNEYPPSPEYCVLFWKKAIKHLESLAQNQDVEVDSRLYDNLISLMNRPPSSGSLGLASPPPPSYITHYFPLDMSDSSVLQKATLLESRTMIEQGTTGLKTWPAALALGEYLLQTPALVQNTNILELGAGVGLLGIIVSSIQLRCGDNNARLRLTDINEQVLTRCRENLSLPCNLSSSHLDLRCQSLDWFAALDVDERPSLQSFLCDVDADLVLGADIVYDPSIIPALIAVLELALSNKSGQREKSAIIALTVRNHTTHKQFLDAAEQAFKITQLDLLKPLILFQYKTTYKGHETQLIQFKSKT